MQHLILLLLVLITASAVTAAYRHHVVVEDIKEYVDRIHPDQLNTIVLTNNGQSAASRRSKYSIAQVSCVGGDACADASKAVTTVKCLKDGFDGMDITWDCTFQNVPQEYTVRYATVSCEGYESPNDVYILRDSCAVEYHLDHVYVHKQQPPSAPSMPSTKTTFTTTTTVIPSADADSFGEVFFRAFCLVIVTLVVIAAVISFLAYCVEPRTSPSAVYVSSSPSVSSSAPPIVYSRAPPPPYYDHGLDTASYVAGIHTGLNSSQPAVRSRAVYISAPCAASSTTITTQTTTSTAPPLTTSTHRDVTVSARTTRR